jgi:DNA polymerase-3 subunit beta
MRFSVNQQQFTRALQLAGRVVSPRASMPILNYILLDVCEGSLRMVATDLEMGIELTVPATVHDNGALALPARLLLEIVSNLPESDVIVSSNGGETRASINCEAARFDVFGLPGSDFPVLPFSMEGVTASVDAGVLRGMIRQTSFAVSTDESRPFLTGIYVIVAGGKIRLVATDGGRLALRSAEATTGETAEFSAIIPAKAMVELMRALGSVEGEVRILYGENQIVFVLPGMRFTTRIIAGQFPNYEQVIPREPKQRIRVGAERFFRAIRRASITARDAANVVRISTSEGVLTVASNTPDVGRAQEDIPAEVEGEAVQAAFNAKFLLDALANVDAAEVVFELTGPLSPGALRPVGREDYVYVLAPVRVYS